MSDLRPPQRHLLRPKRLRALLVLGAVFCCSGTARAQSPFEVLHHLTGNSVFLSSDGPADGLIEGSDGNLYGTTRRGGTFNRGMIFRISRTGAVTVLHSFAGGDGGENPAAALLRATDGNFYGTTEGPSSGRATMFRMTPEGAVSTLYMFPQGCCAPPGRFSPLVDGLDGSVYGTARTNTSPGVGIIFRVTPDGSFVVLHTFAGGMQDGSDPSSFIRGTDGNFYGTTISGGVPSTTCGFLCTSGTVFRMTPAGSVTILHFFKDATAEGNKPTSLTKAADGLLYGTTSNGGLLGKGGAFRLSQDGSGMILLHAFTSSTLDGGPTPLVQASDGNFYGMASANAPATSTIFRMTPAGRVTVLHAFLTAISTVPRRLVQASDGRLYGLKLGGIAGLGTAFTLDLSGTYTVLTDLLITVAEGTNPSSPLLRATDGNFYGTTSRGGIYNRGTIFRMTPAGDFTTLYTFAAGYDGGSPSGALVQASDGHLYGTTPVFGAFNEGIIYRLTLGGTFTILHAFNRGVDASRPNGGLIQGSDGHLYGTTQRGGAADRGTVFRATLDGEVTVLHSFTGGFADGDSPEAPLIEADGFLFGTTAAGGGTETRFGMVGPGTVFRMNAAGTMSILHRFTYATEGANPVVGVTRGGDGYFYGSTGCGNTVVYRIDPTGSFAKIRDLRPGCSSNDYGAPTVTYLTAGAGGVLYGLSSFIFGFYGGPHGLAFAMDRSGGAYAPLHEFPFDRSIPRGPLVQAPDGSLYGADAVGGSFDAGIVFRIIPILPAPLAPSSVVVRARPGAAAEVVWTPVTAASSYTIKRGVSRGGEITLASGLTGTSFRDSSTVRNQRYYYIVTAVNGFGESGASYEVSITAGQAVAGDFDGDGVSDVAVFRPSTGTWSIQRSSTATGDAHVWGGTGDIPVPADYDGDGTTDIAVFRPSTGTWYIRNSETPKSTVVVWGGGDDVPVPADYDGDGKTDIAVFRPSMGTWYIRDTATPTSTVQVWGGGDDVPTPADYDGDGKVDIAVFRPSTGTWYVRNTATPTSTAEVWGGAGDVPVAGDYDGDGKTDIAVLRPSTGRWYIRNSATPTSTVVVWGGGSDVPVPGDYDGDGRADIAVFRPSTGTWYVRNTATPTSTVQVWGGAGDIPNLKRP